MKKTILYNAILSIFLLFFLVSCKNFSLKKTPTILNPSYSIYNLSGEKGYNVSFELNKENEPIYLIINKIKQPITLENKKGLQYQVNVIAETRKIENHKIQGTQQENGIVFRVNNKEVFKPVNFKLK